MGSYDRTAESLGIRGFTGSAPKKQGAGAPGAQGLALCSAAQT